MNKDIAAEFSKVVQHFGQILDRDRLERAVARSTKEEVSKKTKHDTQVVQLNSGYSLKRQEFRTNKGQVVWATVNYIAANLKDHFRQ
jgi:hypothetical protein